MPSPPKPWEVNNTTGSTTATATAEITNSETAPSLPSRPSTMTSNYNGYGTSGYGAPGYGASSYGTSGYGTGMMSSYNSPYNRMGGYGGYGGYNTGFSPYNRMGYNNNMGMMGETPLQQMESSTRATFDVIGSIVQAFGGFAQMLDSTYMVTHSSFMAMVGVAEQFGNLRHYLGNIFNLFGLLRWLKKQFYRMTGKTPPPAEEEGPKENELLEISNETNEIEHKIQQTSSKRRPVLLFLAIVTGLPYLIYKLLQRSHRLKQERMMIPQYGGPVELARVIHTFHGENPMELTIQQGQDIQILSKVDPVSGLPCDWWQGRSHNGSIGIFPANHVHIH
ncbi:hypothetical protein G6F56_000207 [Rhizopus delemar]|nr:hypothetical protein G6F56_000207 [Rhizopus delemar]